MKTKRRYRFQVDPDGFTRVFQQWFRPFAWQTESRVIFDQRRQAGQCVKCGELGTIEGETAYCQSCQVWWWMIRPEKNVPPPYIEWAKEAPRNVDTGLASPEKV